jgi:hypothetical protein
MRSVVLGSLLLGSLLLGSLLLGCLGSAPDHRVWWP